MLTRSQTKRVNFILDIDFDGASEAWRANKISKGNGTYTYACKTIKQNGCKCSLSILDLFAFQTPIIYDNSAFRQNY